MDCGYSSGSFIHNDIVPYLGLNTVSGSILTKRVGKQ